MINSKSIFFFRKRSRLKFFLFLALAATLFNVAERFEQFWWTVTKGTFLYHYFKIDALVKEEKSFKGFSIFSSGSHLVLSRGTVWEILVDSHLKNIPVKFFQNLSTHLAEEVVKSLFLFIALAAILFNTAESFEQFWQRVTQETFLYNYFKIHLLVQEKKSFKGFSIFSSGGRLVQRSRTVWAILVDSHLRNIPVSLFQNRCTG